MTVSERWKTRVAAWWRRSSTHDPMALIAELQSSYEAGGWEPIRARNAAIRDFVIVCEKQARKERQALRKEMRTR